MQKEYKFPCEKCGAKLKFSTSEGELKCEHCSHINIIQRAFENIVEKDYHKAIELLSNTQKKEVELTGIKCQSCAAVFDLNENVHASNCPYCDSAIVSETTTYKPIKPQGLLPFKIDKTEAKKLFKEWLKDLWFAPNKLKQYSGADSKLDGIYIPHWTYDSDTYSRYNGRRGDAYYEKDGDKNVKKIRWHSVSGELSKPFDDVLVMATSSLKHKLHNWDLENLVDYKEAFLSGYESEIYSIELDEGLKSAKSIMESSIRSDIKNQIGGDEQEITSLQSDYDNIKFKHILLPIYASAFNFKGKVYSYIVNGRNGDISGDRPYSVVKITFAVLSALLVGGTLYYNFG